MTTYRITKKKKALKGTGAEDDFFGSKFSDIFDGRAGDDYIYGAEGNDRLTGHDGDDIAYGEAGNDKLYGDAGRDTLYGGEGSDQIFGGESDDYLVGDEGNDQLDGGKGSDYLAGGLGNDKLSGGDGDDTVNGREYTSSSSTFVPGKDKLLGGEGDDLVMVDDGDNAMGGKGVDILDIETSTGSSLYTKYLINFSKITGNRAADIGYGSIKAGQFEKVSASIYSMEIGSLITGSKGSDTIYGSGKGGVINGGAGNDSLSGYSSTSDVGGGIILNGGAGNDKLRGNGAVTLVGGAGDDQFVLNPYNDCTIADFSGKDYFLVRASSFRYHDSDLNQYVTPTFDKVNPVVAGTDPKPATALAQFFYDTDDGKLFYDADGVGLKFDLQLVMTLANKAALDASDFVFVA